MCSRTRGLPGRTEEGRVSTSCLPSRCPLCWLITTHRTAPLYPVHNKKGIGSCSLLITWFRWLAGRWVVWLFFRSLDSVPSFRGVSPSSSCSHMYGPLIWMAKEGIGVRGRDLSVRKFSQASTCSWSAHLALADGRRHHQSLDYYYYLFPVCKCG